MMRLAGCSGALAVGLGAYGAHGLKNLAPTYADVYKTASLYHLLHSGVMLTCAMNLHGRKQKIVCGLFGFGIVAFSGSCYLVAVLQDRAYGKLAPVGGFGLIAGWLAVAFL